MALNPEKPVKIAELFIPEIKQLLLSEDYRSVKQLLKTMMIVDLADAWHAFSPEEQALLFRLLTDRDATTLFHELDFHQQTDLLRALRHFQIESVSKNLTPEETGRLFPPLSEKTWRSWHRLIEKEKQDSTAPEQNYPDHSVGSWMHYQPVALKPSLTTSQALDRIRTTTRLRTGGGPDGYYVTDKTGKAVGYVSLRELIAASSKTKLSSYMSPVGLVRIEPDQDQEDAIGLFTRKKISMAPVVDKNNRLLGYIQAEDIIPLVQEESTEDIHKLGAVEALEDPYFQISFSSMIKKRAPWLLVLFAGQLLTATAMGMFQHVLDQAIILALFIPLIISSGGNSGSQAATLIVRSLALKEINFKDWWRVMKREFLFGLVLGSFLGVLGVIRVMAGAQLNPIYGPHAVLIAFTVGTSLVAIVMWGTLSGSILPIFLRRMGLDPAVVSAPFIATLVDVVGLLIYFLTATFLLKGTLLY